uniref:Variant surface glycoprotein 1125.4172 n=3 Tax=Trypanosoma brucei TaxID=5691 RepID=A0A1J0RA73_9TRYP|nr:variant surface glycoprotein 1125.4172 [Trypanosoma brucei]
MMMKFAKLIITIALATTYRRAVAEKADTGAEYKALCWLIRLSQEEPESVVEDPAASAALANIELLNMTLSEESWQQLFNDDTAANNWQAVQEKYTDAGQKQEWQGLWEKWRDAAKRLKTKNTDATWTAKHTVPKLILARKLQQAELAKLAEAATSTYQAYKAAINDAKTKLSKEITDDLDTALNGDKAAKTGKVAPTNWDFGSAARDQNTCKGNKVGKNLIYDIACLCIATTGTNSKGCTGTAPARGWTSTNSQVQEDVQKMLGSCGDLPKVPLSAATLRAAITQFYSSIGRGSDSNNKAGILGHSSQPQQCSGGADNICVLYDEYFSDAGTPKTATMPWAAAVLAAANKLDLRKRKVETADKLLRELLMLETSAEGTFKLSKLTPDMLPSPSNQPQQQTPKEADCNKQQNNSTCKSPCTWNDKATDPNKKCSLDPKKAAEQATQAAETTGAAAATSGCARHGSDKAACENDKTGDKQNCAWRKGKDGEDEKEIEKCRNGSFLENNK